MAKPIFCATHPRACSTAFERVFMTRNDLACIHEPFGDAFYYGPERMSCRFEEDEQARTESGFSDSTFQSIFDHIDQEGSESLFPALAIVPKLEHTYQKQGQRVFIKDITYYLIPPDSQAPKIAPSLERKKRGIGTETNGINRKASQKPFPFNTDEEPGNPTVVPKAILDKFQFTFLIRDPHSSIPSYYRCTVPPLDEVTGFYDYYPNEAGYDELRRFFDYLCHTGAVGPELAGAVNGHSNGQTDGHANGDGGQSEICIIDADDLLDNPEGILRQYCQCVGLEYSSDMLNWDNEQDQAKAKEAFLKWKGFHEDAIDSKDLKPRGHKKAPKTEDQWDAEWKEKFGDKAAAVIRKTVDANMEHYHYLKQFVLKA